MNDLAARAPGTQVITVSELNRRAKALLEQELPLAWVAGEVSNFKRYDSGHCYFTLKDAQAQVDCVMFRHRYQYLGWLPDNGMQVEVRACPTLYEQRGKFQLNVEAMRRAGLGALYEAYERLKARLGAEGLFDASHKRPLPAFPRAIGVVTSLQAAALRDVLTTLARRMPGLPVIVYPTPVQGEGAAQRIARAVTEAGSHAQCDVLILCRGGGSIEDLWAYNEEAVARALRACPIPVVTGIGHETDFTIADFAADTRAPTPTAAAELASPDRAELRGQLLHWQQRLCRMMERTLENRMQRLDYLARSLVHPGERLRNRREALMHLARRLGGAWQRAQQEEAWALHAQAQRLAAAVPDIAALLRHDEQLARRLRDALRNCLQTAAARVDGAAAHLRHLDPQQVLERGYSITEAADGGIVRDSAHLTVGEDVRLVFAAGWAGAQVKRKG